MGRIEEKTMSNTKLWAVTLLGLALFAIFWAARPALTPVLWALVIAYLLNPLVLYCQKKTKMAKGWSIALVLLLIVFILGFLANLIWPPIRNQASSLMGEFHVLSGNFQQILDQFQSYMEGLGLAGNLLEAFDQALRDLYNLIGNFLMGLLSSTLSYIFGAMDMIIVAVLVIYFLASGAKMRNQILKQAPKSWQPTMENLIKETDQVIWSYVRTQVIIAVILGIVSTLAYYLIGLRFAFLLGMLAGILNLIPFLGSIIAGVLAVLMALLTSGPNKAIIALIVVLVIQQVEGNLITPRLQGKSTGMHPVVIIIALLVCNYFWGVLGMFVAVPVLGLARMAMKEVLILINRIP